MANDRKLAFSSKLSFGVGQFAEGLKNAAFGAFVMFYYNQVLGLPGTVVGVALGIALIFDAVTDPLAGSLSDNWHSRLGRRHPFMYASAIPLGITFYFLFNPPAGLSETWLFVWVLALSILTRTAMTLYHVPHIALGAEMTENYQERTLLVSFRQFFGTFGGIFAVYIGFQYFFAATPEYEKGGQFNPDAYGPYAIFLGVLMVITIWWSAWGTRKEIPFLPAPSGPKERLNARGMIARMGRELWQALQNHSFRWLFIGVLILYVMVGVDAALNIYVNNFFWGLTPPQMAILALPTGVGVMLGVFLTPVLHRLFDKKPGLVWGVAWWSACQIVPVLLALAGLFPESGSTTLVWTLFAIRFVQGVGVVQAIVSFGSMMADVADEHELATGRRQEGIFFGAVAFSGKAASGVGSIVAGIGLDAINWPRGANVQGPGDVPYETIVDLAILFGPVVAGFAVVSVWCLSKYQLNRERHQEILKALEARRAEQGDRDRGATVSYS